MANIRGPSATAFSVILAVACLAAGSATSAADQARSSLRAAARIREGVTYTVLTRDEVERINREITGPAHAILHAGNLDNAVGCQNRVLFGAAVYPTLADKVACLSFNLAQGHPFHDGNKRTASLAAEILVKKNRNGRGLTKAPAFIIGDITEAEPMARDHFETAIAKLVPPPLRGEEA